MANVKTIGGAVVNTAGVALVSKTVTLKNDDTGATITTTTTNADGEWEFANRDETIRYRAEAAFGGSSSQVVVRKPASAEFDHLYANLSFRTAAAATVALGGPLVVGGTLTMGGAIVLVDGTVALPSLTFGGDTNTGLYRVGEGQVALVSNGVARVTAGTTGAGVTGVLAVSSDATVSGTLTASHVTVAGGLLTLAAGTVGAPSLIFGSDTGSGLYRIGANNDGYALGGIKTIDLGGATATTAFSTTATGKVPVRISGIAAQTADMFQIRNSANTLLFAVEANGQTDVLGPLNISGSVGFYGTSPIGGPNTVTGSKGGNVALGNLINVLKNMGLFIDSTT